MDRLLYTKQTLKSHASQPQECKCIANMGNGDAQDRVHLKSYCKDCSHCQKQENKKWEEEFITKFPGGLWSGPDKEWGEVQLTKQVKSFIHSLLSQQKQNLIREVEKLFENRDVAAEYYEGVSDVLSLLKGEK